MNDGELRSMPSSLRFLLVSTPVGPLGSGLGGGVELTLPNLAQALVMRNHTVTIVAPTGSTAPFPLVEIPGTLQMTAQSSDRSTPITLPSDSVLANLWHYAHQVQADYDLIVNFAYDWLPFYLTPFFQCPIAHLVSMGSLSDAMDQVIASILQTHPDRIAFHSRVQAETFPMSDRACILANGFDLSLYQFQAHPQDHLGWVGRIAPEKGLEDAIAATQTAQIPLKIWGVIQDTAYWHEICQRHPRAIASYQGFLTTHDLQQALGMCRGLLMTPHWVEAFGNVAIEALACGVPVIAYRRGGPAEIVMDGKTGWLVEPDSIDGLIRAIAQLDQIDRRNCRHQAETHYSLEAMGDRLEQWFATILKI